MRIHYSHKPMSGSPGNVLQNDALIVVIVTRCWSRVRIFYSVLLLFINTVKKKALKKIMNQFQVFVFTIDPFILFIKNYGGVSGV